MRGARTSVITDQREICRRVIDALPSAERRGAQLVGELPERLRAVKLQCTCVYVAFSLRGTTSRPGWWAIGRRREHDTPRS